jgi:hypothetical protein
MEKCGFGIQFMNTPDTQYCRSDNTKNLFLQGSAPGGYPHGAAVAAAGSAPGSYPRDRAAAARGTKNEQKKKKKIVLAANFAAFGNQ